MEQEPGVAGFISLSEHEQRYYSGLHNLCQADTSGKLSSGKVAELFKASQLPPESLHKVSPAAHLRLCGCVQLPVARLTTGTTRIMLPCITVAVRGSGLKKQTLDLLLDGLHCSELLPSC